MLIEQSNAFIEWKLYMYLLRCAIRGEKLENKVLEQYKEIDSKRIRERSVKNGQGFMLDEYISEYAKYRQDEECERKNSIGSVVIRYEKFKYIRNVLERAKEENILMVVFKGCVLADLYPQYIQRDSCDTDIFVYYEDKQRAIDMLLSMNYKIVEEHSKEEVTVFKHVNQIHVIELHTCIWEDYEGKRLDILKSCNLTDKDTLITMQTCGFEVTTFGYEEHLIYQLFHIIKHFSLEGIGVKYLADIALYVDKYGKYINNETFWNKLEKLDYARFTYYLMAICVEFLGMDDLLIRDKQMEMGDEIVEFMLDMFDAGSADGEKDSWQILGMMTPYFVGEKKSSKNKFARKLAVAFPRPKDLPDHLSYAKKYPILLFIAWIHKAILYFIKYFQRGKSWYSVSEKLDVAERRVDLMDKMGLLG